MLRGLFARIRPTRSPQDVQIGSIYFSSLLAEEVAKCNSFFGLSSDSRKSWIRRKSMKQLAQVMPMISVDSVDLARDFYVEKLGFSQMMGVIAKDGEFSFCTMVLNGGKVMFSRPQEK